MDKGQFRCKHCRKLKGRRVEDQKYCGEKACQQARRNTWRREKYADDWDYRRNQQASTAAWLSSRGGAAAYYRQYRSKRKALGISRERGLGEEESGVSRSTGMRCDEKMRAERSLPEAGANRDAGTREFRLKTGRYKICPFGAKRDAFFAEIWVISDG